MKCKYCNRGFYKQHTYDAHFKTSLECMKQKENENNNEIDSDIDIVLSDSDMTPIVHEVKTKKVSKVSKITQKKKKDDLHKSYWKLYYKKKFIQKETELYKKYYDMQTALRESDSYFREKETMKYLENIKTMYKNCDIMHTITQQTFKKITSNTNSLEIMLSVLLQMLIRNDIITVKTKSEENLASKLDDGQIQLGPENKLYDKKRDGNILSIERKTD